MQATVSGFRLSPQQESIWMAGEKTPGSTGVVACLAQIDGDIRAEQIHSRLSAAMHRHEILRTDLQVFPGMNIPLQSIRENKSVAVIEYNFETLDAKSLNKEVDKIFREAIEKCACGTPSSLCVRLARYKHNRSFVILALSNLCGDEATLIRLVKTLIQESTESAEMVQYADLAECLQQFLSSEEFREARSYWSSLTPSRQISRLPGQVVAQGDQPSQSELVGFVLEPEALAWLTELAAKRAVPESAVLLACWMLLFSRFTGESEPIVGLQCDGRIHEDLKPALGPLSRYVPLVAAVNAKIPFCDFLQKVSAAMEGCELHQEYYDPRSASPEAQDPGFSFCFEYSDARLTPENSALSARMERLISSPEKLPIKLQGMRRDSDIALNIHYDGRSFTGQRIERMSASLKALLECALRQPGATCGELEILGLEEKQTLAITPNRTVHEYSRHSGLHDLVEEQAFKNHEAVAIIANGSRLTYGELNEQANRLASYLRQRGLVRGGAAAVCIPKSPGLVTVLMAVLKAGAAYVPLDPAYPAERIGFILEDAKIQLVITVEAFASLFPANINVICLDRDDETIQRQSGASLQIKSYPESLAYIIYTSGSTGKPKGVLIPHRTLINYLNWSTRAYAMAEGTGALVTSTVAFDLTVTTLWGPLVAGKTAVLLTGEPAVEKLKEELLKPGPFVLKLTPAEMSLAQHFLKPEECAASVGAVVIGGEALYGESLSFWRERAAETRFINEYGPTETTVGCCVYEVPPGKAAEGAVPIGRPIANTSIYVLNEEFQLQPTEVVGEIYIGGECVGHGYCNQPGATAERFLPDVFSSVAGGRMYRTGDLARWREDGNLEYLGRNDGQVKIRGYRIEIGEVEAELRKLAGVEEAAVVVRGDVTANRHLAGYVVLRDASQTHDQWVGDIRTQLLHVLPEYMIPSAFVSLDRLPLTSNGKVDRQALSKRMRRSEGDGEVPRGDIEMAIAAVWKEVLAVNDVGAEDNFFELGGHSLALFQVHFKLQSTLNSDVTVVDLLAHPTVRALAQHLAGSKVEQAELLSLEERASKRKISLQRRKEIVELEKQAQ
jgi:amino acid adenylation domain-containing protein